MLDRRNPLDAYRPPSHGGRVHRLGRHAALPFQACSCGYVDLPLLVASRRRQERLSGVVFEATFFFPFCVLDGSIAARSDRDRGAVAEHLLRNGHSVPMVCRNEGIPKTLLARLSLGGPTTTLSLVSRPNAARVVRQNSPRLSPRLFPVVNEMLLSGWFKVATFRVIHARHKALAACARANLRRRPRSSPVPSQSRPCSVRFSEKSCYLFRPPPTGHVAGNNPASPSQRNASR